VRRPPRSVLLVAGLLVVLLVVALVVRSCTGPTATIRVYAESSLRHAFADLGRAFEEEHGVAVDLTVDSAGKLTRELADQPVPDVFAAGDATSLVQINDAIGGEPLVFAEDQLVIAVPEGNPSDVRDWSDLVGTDVALCFHDEPCGRLAQYALAPYPPDRRPKLAVAPDSARTMALVVDGSVDAGLVLASEASAAGDAVETVEVPAASDRVSYPSITLLDGATDADHGQEFIDFVLGEDGQAILAANGFASAVNPYLQPEE
jgi:molybdate transport system substrate-binding protein